MTLKPGVDHYDGHMLLTEEDGDDLVHEVIHPLNCEPVYPYPDEMPDFIDYECIPAWHARECGDWELATSPGLRVVGFRHEAYSFGYATEHDLICFVLPELVGL